MQNISQRYSHTTEEMVEIALETAWGYGVFKKKKKVMYLQNLVEGDNDFSYRFQVLRFAGSFTFFLNSFSEGGALHFIQMLQNSHHTATSFSLSFEAKVPCVDLVPKCKFKRRKLT